MSKKVLVLGASPNPDRYSNRAIRLLRRYGHEVMALGMRKGEVAGIPIHQELNETEDIHTVTLYLGPNNQHGYYKLLQEIKPRRVIFNPGTENEELQALLQENGIQVIENCTLVMLNNEMF